MIQLARTTLLLLLLTLLSTFAEALPSSAGHRGRRWTGHAFARRSQPAAVVEGRWEKRDVAANLASPFPSTNGLNLFTTSISSLSSSPLTVLTNTTHALLSLNVSSSLTFSLGWVALGLGGTQMANTHQMVIAWPSSAPSAAANSGWAISNRRASGHSMPKPVDPSQATPAQLIPELSQASEGILTFVVPFARSSDPAKQGLGMLYAYSSSKVSPPASGNPDDASIAMHDDGKFGSFTADLGKAVTVGAGGVLTGGAGGSGSKGAGGKTSYEKVIMWHAIIGALAWMVVAPAAILIGRLGRNWGSWLKAHRALQAGLTVTLTLITVVLAVVAIKSKGTGFTAGGHQILGFLIAIGVIIQAVLGQYAHARVEHNRTKRPGRNVTHILLGCTLLAAGWTQVYLGLKLYNKTVTGGLPSKNNLFIVWAVFLMVPIVLYVISCMFLVSDRRRKQGMPLSFAAFGLGRDSPEQQNARLPEHNNYGAYPKEESEKGWPPYVADLAQAQQKEEEEDDRKGFFGRLFKMRRPALGRDRSLVDPDSGVMGGKVSPFEYDAFGNPVQKEEGHKSWGNGVFARSELDEFNSQALARGFALAVDAQPNDNSQSRGTGTPIAQQYGYGQYTAPPAAAPAQAYYYDPNVARERAGGLREMQLSQGLTADPTAGYRGPVAQQPQYGGRQPYQPARELYNPTHQRGSGSVGGQSESGFSNHSAGSSGSRRPLVQGGGFYSNHAQRALERGF